MSSDVRPAPLNVQQWHYKRCRHVRLFPQPIPGAPFRIVAFLDIGGLCPTCQSEETPAKRKPR